MMQIPIFIITPLLLVTISYWMIGKYYLVKKERQVLPTSVVTAVIGLHESKLKFL